VSRAHDAIIFLVSVEVSGAGYNDATGQNGDNSVGSKVRSQRRSDLAPFTMPTLTVYSCLNILFENRFDSCT